MPPAKIFRRGEERKGLFGGNDEGKKGEYDKIIRKGFLRFKG